MRCDEVLNFRESGHEVGASMTRDNDCTGCAPHANGPLERPALQRAEYEAAGKRIAGAKHVQNLD